MEKKKTRVALIKETRELIKKSWLEIIEIVPLIRIYAISWEKELENSNGGHFEISYIPETFNAVLSVYSGVYERSKVDIEWTLCHEAGHVYLEGYQGGYKDIEKTATLIGELIFKILIAQRKNGKAKKKRL